MNRKKKQANTQNKTKKQNKTKTKTRQKTKNTKTKQNKKTDMTKGSYLDYGYGLFSLRLIWSAMFGAPFNLITCVALPYFFFAILKDDSL